MTSKLLLTVLMIACLSTAFEIDTKPKAKPTFWRTAGCIVPDCNTCPTPDDGTCDQCNDGFYLFDTTTCENCKTGADGKIDNCAKCTYDAAATPALTCTMCDFTFYLDETNACQSCVTSPSAIADCKDCTYDIPTTTVTCKNCDAGFYANGNTKCESCSSSAFMKIDNCAQCAYDAAATPQLQCSQCAVGFYLASNGTQCNPCTDISNGCSECKADDNNGTNKACTRCLDQYLFQAGDCIQCASKYPDCTNCDMDNNTCNTCAPSFYRAAQGTGCTPCIDAVKDCNLCAATDDQALNVPCTECNVGFYLDGLGLKCNPCTDISGGCIECTADDNNGTNKACTKCQDQYIKQVNDCIACGSKYPGCTNCEMTNNTCNVCEPTFYRAAKGTGCVQCTKEVINCKLCTASGDLTLDVTCDQCNPNFILTNPKDCTACNVKFPNCLVCDTTTPSCTTCVDGFYSLSTTQCESCSTSAVKNIQNCSICSYDLPNDKLTCSQCQASYFIYNDGDKCQSCSTSAVHSVEGCNDCTYDQTQDAFKCNGCTNSYYLNAQATCDLCNAGDSAIPNCLTCTGTYLDVKCTSCADRYYPEALTGKCALCSDAISDCDACQIDAASTNLVCNHCGNGKVLTDGKCEDSSASTIIIVSAVVGGVVLMGAGFAIFKCMKKRKIPLAEDDYEKI